MAVCYWYATSVYSHTHSLPHSLTHSHTHSLKHSLTQTLTHSLTVLLACDVCILTHSLTYAQLSQVGVVAHRSQARVKECVVKEVQNMDTPVCHLAQLMHSLRYNCLPTRCSVRLNQ